MSEFTTFERDGWAQRGPEYATGFGAFTARCVPALLDAVEPCAGRLLLDVGTGPGIAAGAAAVRGAVVVGLDESAQMLAAAGRRLPRRLRARVQQLPLRDDVIDIVVGNLVVNHLPDQPAGVAELVRVLRRGGRLALTAWDQAGRNEATAIISRAMEVAGVRPPATPRQPSTEHAEPARFESLLVDAGLSAVRVEPIAFTHVVQPDAWWTAVRSGTLRSAAELAGLDERTRAGVRAAYLKLIREYVDAEGLAHLPALAWLASGRR